MYCLNSWKHQYEQYRVHLKEKDLILFKNSHESYVYKEWMFMHLS